VSPNSPLLSTTVQNNAWVCGELGAPCMWRGAAAEAGRICSIHVLARTFDSSWVACRAGFCSYALARDGAACTWPAQSAAAAELRTPRLDTAVLCARGNRARLTGDNGRGQLGVSGAQAVLVPQPIQVGGGPAGLEANGDRALADGTNAADRPAGVESWRQLCISVQTRGRLCGCMKLEQAGMVVHGCGGTCSGQTCQQCAA
jgi:hypothetical protein